MENFSISNTTYDICDIIVEKILGDHACMRNTNERWEKVQYTRSQIDKAGKIIASGNATNDQIAEALKVLNNWRASHAYPLHVIATNLRRRNSHAIVVQRLKRLDSIVGKLKRFQDMSLYGMQDLGGCRVIVDSIDDVYKSLNTYKNSRIRHILKRENDYIQFPKTSGYRSYHIVYQFHSDTTEDYNRNMRIEIQFRTKLQHIWATAVEVMGIYTKSALKASMGDADVLRFFSLVSSVFALMEKTPTVPDTPNNMEDLLKEIRRIDAKNNIVSTISGLRTAIEHVKGNRSNGYFLLILNYETKHLRIQGFKPSHIEEATYLYNKVEATAGENIDAVLVSASSFDSLRVSYPNYFADIGQFVDMMRKILG